MIAPRLRLVLVMFLVAVPLATAAGLSRGFSPIAFLLIGFALIVALVRSRPWLSVAIETCNSLFPTFSAESGTNASNSRSGRTFLSDRTIPLRLAVAFPEGLHPEQEQTNYPGSPRPLPKHSFEFLSWAPRVVRSIFTAFILIGVPLSVSGFIVTIDPSTAKSASTRT